MKISMILGKKNQKRTRVIWAVISIIVAVSMVSSFGFSLILLIIFLLVEQDLSGTILMTNFLKSSFSSRSRRIWKISRLLYKKSPKYQRYKGPNKFKEQNFK